MTINEHTADKQKLKGKQYNKVNNKIINKSMLVFLFIKSGVVHSVILCGSYDFVGFSRFPRAVAALAL